MFPCKHGAGLLLTDAEASAKWPVPNPHYARLLDPAHPRHDPAAYPVLYHYFALTRHAGRPVLVVQALPANAADYKALDSEIQRLRRESDVLYAGRPRPQSNTATDDTTDTPEPTDSLLRQWDRLHYNRQRTPAEEAELMALSERIQDMQQRFFAYEALQRLAVPLRIDDSFNSYRTYAKWGYFR